MMKYPITAEIKPTSNVPKTKGIMRGFKLGKKVLNVMCAQSISGIIFFILGGILLQYKC